jgi:hypothetical protein
MYYYSNDSTNNVRPNTFLVSLVECSWEEQEGDVWWPNQVIRTING